MKFVPYGDRILIEQHAEELKGGLILHDDDVKKRPLGAVIALGDGYHVQSSGIKVGETVVFLEQSGERVAMGGKELLVIQLKDVLGRQYAD